MSISSDFLLLYCLSQISTNAVRTTEDVVRFVSKQKEVIAASVRVDTFLHETAELAKVLP